MNYPSTLATTSTNPQLKEDNKSNSQLTSPKLKQKTDSNLLIKSKSGVMLTSKTKANNVNNTTINFNILILSPIILYYKTQTKSKKK